MNGPLRCPAAFHLPQAVLDGNFLEFKGKSLMQPVRLVSKSGLVWVWKGFSWESGRLVHAAAQNESHTTARCDGRWMQEDRESNTSPTHKAFETMYQNQK